MTTAQRIEEVAACWLLRREEPQWSADDEQALNAWLEESLAHKAAYWRLEHGWREADRIAALGGEPVYTASNDGPWRWRPWAIAASFLAMLSLGLVLFLQSERLADPSGTPVAEKQITTTVGGRRSLALADGSRVELNTATVLRTAVDASRREVWLDSGEAFFDVAHAEGRPFLVHAGPRTVTVLGTRFSVRREGDRVTVSVLDGRVRVDAADQNNRERSTTITTGDIVIAQGPTVLVAENSADRVQARLAWRNGMLQFDQTTLADAAAEFNRYNRRQLIIGDPEAASIRIGGTFQASNVDAFVRLLRSAYGLRVEAREESVTVSS